MGRVNTTEYQCQHKGYSVTTINTNTNAALAQTQLQRSSQTSNVGLQQTNGGQTGSENTAASSESVAEQFLQSELSEIDSAVMNNERANAMLSTADAALSEITVLLDDIAGVITTTSANSDSLSAEEVEANQVRIDESVGSIDAIARSTTFAGRRLLGGGSGEDGNVSLELQVGSVEASQSSIQVELTPVEVSQLGSSSALGSLSSLASGGEISLSAGKIENSASVVNAAREEVSSARSRIGAVRSDTLRTNVDSLSRRRESLSGSGSHLADTEFATETANLLREQILVQADASANAVANSLPQNVLSLLG